MRFLDISFFTGDIHIPNLEGCIKDLDTLRNFAEWEKEGLELVLGKCLAEELISQTEIKTDSAGKKYYGLKDNIDEKWNYLIDGRTYTKDDENVSYFSDLSSLGCGCSNSVCEKHFWEGLITKQSVIINDEERFFKESLLAYYVYFQWAHNNRSVTSGVGEQVPKAKNSSNVDNKENRINAWNYFWQKTRSCAINGKIGLHGFLNEHQELFPNFIEIPFDPQNYYAI